MTFIAAQAKNQVLRNGAVLLGLTLFFPVSAACYPACKDEQTILKLFDNGPAKIKALQINGKEAPVGGYAGD